MITLGIIGVIAAMVLPTVVGKCNEMVRKAQFKRAYTLLASAIQKVEQEQEQDYFDCSYGKNYNGSEHNNIDNCPTFMNEVANKLKPIKFCDGNAIERGCLPSNPPYKGWDEVYMENNPDIDENDIPKGHASFFSSRLKNNKTYVFNDGIILILYGNPKVYPVFAVDINGFKAPNKWGYDFFMFTIERQTPESGVQLKPKGGHPVEKGGKRSDEFFLSL